MIKNIDYEIHDDVELTAETVVPRDGPSAAPNIPVMSDEVAALCMLSRALAVAVNMGMMTWDEVEWVAARVAKSAARRGRQR
jgi:hypothetical protein